MNNPVKNNTANNYINWQDYLELTKPKVVLLLMVTAIAGMFLATNPAGMVPWDVLILGSIGMSFAMGAAAVINHVMDRQIDLQMARTSNRPVATGKINPQIAMAFAAILSIISIVILDQYINRLTAMLTFVGIVGYAFIYTMFLKRATPQNIVIGGLAGAIPPMLGWTAVTNELHPHAILLVLIIFIWTPPHFWALAIHRRDEYAKAGIPMLPVTHGIEFTKTQVLLYTILLAVTCIMPFALKMCGLIYLIVSSILSIIFIAYALKLKYRPKDNTAMQTFAFSILHLFILFIVLLIDHYFPFYI